MQTFVIANVSTDIEAKADSEKQYYVTGYISTTDLDRVNDVVTQDCLNDMLLQIKNRNIKLDIEHEVVKDNKLPFGRIIDAGLDKKGLWVRAVLNTAYPDFEKYWKSVQSGFLDAFSILYRPIRFMEKQIAGKAARLLTKLDLVNVAITGNPVNPECRMTASFAKSLDALRSENMDKKEMMDDDKKKEMAEKKEAAKDDKKETKEVDDKKEEKENKSGDECDGKNCPYKEKLDAMDEKAKKKSVSDIEAEMKAIRDEMVELKNKLKEPILKSIVEVPQLDKKSVEKESPKTPLDFIR
jgi:phage head maturation protease